MSLTLCNGRNALVICTANRWQGRALEHGCQVETFSRMWAVLTTAANDWLRHKVLSPLVAPRPEGFFFAQFHVRGS